MKIYIFRHAQKALDFSGDPDLTPEGHAQASKLLDRVLKAELDTPTQLWVSPKKRTHSTFRPLAQHFRLPLQEQDALLEQHGDETLSEFRQRILNLLEKAAESNNGVLFLCSHYDWVIEAMSVIPADTDLTKDEFSHWSPCQYVAFHINNEGVFEYLDLKRITL
ncbi:SixA phosphatase family protein [Bdellovibrio sp. HCB2-146]|uniref:SixA phosphatase family protein n=1 Tax=Bdellovibrio sp. HCB2-146 TaxID=3394362 RepID=UPI0039BD2B28